MTVHSLPRQTDAQPVLTAYFQATPGRALVDLRPLTALEQMYAYWGSDRA
jgi:hypothetical protein